MCRERLDLALTDLHKCMVPSLAMHCPSELLNKMAQYLIIS